MSKSKWPRSRRNKRSNGSRSFLNKTAFHRKSFYEIGPPSWIKKVINAHTLEKYLVSTKVSLFCKIICSTRIWAQKLLRDYIWGFCKQFFIFPIEKQRPTVDAHVKRKKQINILILYQLYIAYVMYMHLWIFKSNPESEFWSSNRYLSTVIDSESQTSYWNNCDCN